jgi:uncharacterized protein Veg
MICNKCKIEKRFFYGRGKTCKDCFNISKTYPCLFIKMDLEKRYMYQTCLNKLQILVKDFSKIKLN